MVKKRKPRKPSTHVPVELRRGADDALFRLVFGRPLFAVTSEGFSCRISTTTKQRSADRTSNSDLHDVETVATAMPTDQLCPVEGTNTHG